MSARSTVRRLATVATVLSVLPVVAACAPRQALPPPSCTEGDTVILVAQSVPTAELVPCFDPLPAGWEVSSVDIDQDGTTVEFDSDRAGDGAATFRYAASCELGEAVDAPSAHAGTDRFDLIEQIAPSFRAKRFYVFEGGCIWWEFAFDEGAGAALSIELGERLGIETREQLAESIRDSFIDVDL